jgi:hypothetical protein
MLTDVWVLLERDYEDTVLQGVFATAEAAQQVVAKDWPDVKWKQSSHGNWYGFYRGAFWSLRREAVLSETADAL